MGFCLSAAELAPVAKLAGMMEVTMSSIAKRREGCSEGDLRSLARSVSQRAACVVLALAGLLSFGLAQALDVERSVRMMINADTSGLPGRVELEIGSLGESTRRAPCERPEPYLPAGTRLWGRASIGVRCAEGAGWNVLVPIHVRVFAPVLKAAQPLAVNRTLGEQDVRIEEVDLTREAPGALLNLAEADGKVLARPVAAGSVLRRDHLKAPSVVAQGDQVKIVHSGSGFTISTTGRALQSAAAGQSVRVQVDSGRVLTGVAREERVVQVRF